MNDNKIKLGNFFNFKERNSDLIKIQIEKIQEKRKIKIKEYDDLLKRIERQKGNTISIYDKYIKKLNEIEKSKSELNNNNNNSDSLNKFGELFKKFNDLTKECEKFMENNSTSIGVIEKTLDFPEKWLTQKRIRDEPDEIKELSDDENSDLDINSIHNSEDIIEELKSIFPDLEKNFLVECAKPKVRKELIIEKPIIKKLEGKYNSILLKFSFSKLLYSNNNRLNNTNSITRDENIRINNLIQKINENFTPFFDPLFTQFKDDEYLIGGKLNSITTISALHAEVSSLTLRNEEIAYCSISIYRMLEDVLVDTDFCNLSLLEDGPESRIKYVSLVRDYLKNINN